MFEGRDEAIHELLKEQGLVRLSQLEEVRQKALATGVSLAASVVECGLLDRASLLAAIAAYLGIEAVTDPPRELPLEIVKLVPDELARSYGVVPLRVESWTLALLAMDPFDRQIATDLTFALSREVRLLVCDPERIRSLLSRHYPTDDGTAAGRVGESPPMAVDRDVPALSGTELAAMAEQAPVVRFVNLVLEQAVRDRASDIHFEPFETECKIRYRIDGVLYEMTPPPKALALPIASRIKVLAELNIAEQRVPQDGRIRTTLAGRAVDLRVSTLPTQFGESIVLRILDQSAGRLDLPALGMPPEILSDVEEVIRRPNGLFVVTGPTGSGKTTTLYSGLSAINTADLKLLTAEDPVEYELDGVMQMSVNPAAGLTFATAMRAFLRQDPDVVMVGEIRDLETAQIAIQASLTGHLVLSTLHTNDAPTAITRLLDLGVEPFLVANTLAAVLAQRLLRRICPDCREPWTAPPELLRTAGISAENRTVFQGRGCPACAQSGYRGRRAIYEWLPMTDALRDLVGEGAPAGRMQELARQRGGRTLRDAGLEAAFAGETTLEEVLKHT